MLIKFLNIILLLPVFERQTLPFGLSFFFFKFLGLAHMQLNRKRSTTPHYLYA